MLDYADCPYRAIGKQAQYCGADEPAAPVAEFTEQCSATESSCTFDASGSRDLDGTVESYAWDFGDGGTGTGVAPEHTYAEAGEYRVTLTVTDDDGRTGTATRTVRAGTPPDTGEPPSASFTVSCYYDDCSFDASRSTDADGDLASYSWKFGDGGTGDGKTTSHRYPASGGNYTAELTVADRAGHTATTSRTIQCWSFGSRAYCFT
nr:PKD domain-containing protein [Amycolatopsis palatopharyngis]